MAKTNKYITLPSLWLVPAGVLGGVLITSALVATGGSAADAHLEGVQPIIKADSEGTPDTQASENSAQQAAETVTGTTFSTSEEIFLSVLDAHNILVLDEEDTVELAHVLCDGIEVGLTLSEMVDQMTDTYSEYDAAFVIGAANGALCPDQELIFD